MCPGKRKFILVKVKTESQPRTPTKIDRYRWLDLRLLGRIGNCT